MLQSIAQDIRNSFDFGNMVIKLVIINIAVFLITALTEAFFPFFYQSHILPYLAVPGDIRLLIYRPWTVLTHMFVHSGIWHLAWNMITLFWFGNIAGDLLGDRRILPVYIMGGLTGYRHYGIGCFSCSDGHRIYGNHYCTGLHCPSLIIWSCQN